MTKVNTVVNDLLLTFDRFHPIHAQALSYPFFLTVLLTKTLTILTLTACFYMRE